MPRLLLLFLLVTLVCAATTAPASAAVEPTVLTISVDARTPGTRRIPVRLSFAARPGPLTLVYPRWLPGMHAVEGPLANVARLTVAVDGKPLVWARDPYDAYLIRVDVPKGARTVEAAYDYVPPRGSGAEVFYGVAASRNIAVLNPSAFALAPAGDPQAFRATLSVRLPRGWTAATALTPAAPAAGGADPDTVTFAPTSLYTLIDSPILAGAYRRTVTLPVTAPGDVPHTLDLYAESAEGLAEKEATVAPLFARMVAESGRMFGTRHYRAFHFMLALTSEIGRNGLEHHESVLYVLQPGDLEAAQVAAPGNAWNANLIPHEFVHSWNGKFRRPYGQAVRSNIAPQSSDLIWVYEGLTEYLGEVLMVRSGFRSAPAWRRDMTGRVAAFRDGGFGRDWQSLADAALAAPHTYVYGNGTSLRPVNDIYYDSAQVWLEADAILRRESGGARSLDDFCRAFFGGPNRGAEVIPYTRKDVVAALKRVLPTFDWDAFIRDRFYGPPKGRPVQGLRAAGWPLVFAEAPPELAREASAEYRYSLGASVLPDGRVAGVLPDSPLEKAGIAEGNVILGANGFVFSPVRLRDAVRGTKDGKTPLDLLVSDGAAYRTVRVPGLDGERYPYLARDPNAPDYLSAICAPRASWRWHVPPPWAPWPG